jgi:hypothetical protein
MKVTDLGKGGRTFRINLAKGDEVMSALTDFAELVPHQERPLHRHRRAQQGPVRVGRP